MIERIMEVNWSHWTCRGSSHGLMLTLLLMRYLVLKSGSFFFLVTCLELLLDMPGILVVDVVKGLRRCHRSVLFLLGYNPL